MTCLVIKVSEAPETIWAWRDAEYDATLWNDHGDKRYTPKIAVEYTRKDCVDALIEEAVKAERDRCLVAFTDLRFPAISPQTQKMIEQIAAAIRKGKDQ